METTRLHDLEFNIERSCRYHARREAFFDLWHKVTMGVSLLAGSSAFAAFFAISSAAAPSKLGLGASATVAVLTTANLVIGFSHKARDHQILYSRFKRLAVDLLDQKMNPDTRPEVVQRSLLLIEVDERPIYRALDASCYNEVVRAMYSDPAEVWEHSIPLRWRHKILMHLARFSDNDFRPRGKVSLQKAT